MALVMGGSIKVSCLPRGERPGLRGGVGSRRRATVVGCTAATVEEVDDPSSETDRHMLVEVAGMLAAGMLAKVLIAVALSITWMI